MDQKSRWIGMLAVLVPFAAFTFCGCNLDGARSSVQRTSAIAQNGASSLERFWVDLNQKAEKLDVSSSMDALEQQKQKLSDQIKGMRAKAGDDYNILTAQYQRLDAAERLKQAETEIGHLKETGQALQSTADKASAAVEDAKAKYRLAQSKYLDVKHQAEKAASNAGLSWP